jgi:hypothetical protein
VSITDILLLGPGELNELCNCYPGCKVERLTTSESLIQQYRVQIEVEDEDDYYSLLLSKSIAMSSHSFYSKVKSDKNFSDRIKRKMGFL